MYYDRFTRLLHFLLAPVMAVQLVVSLLMTHPKPGRPGDLLYEVHEYLGLALLGILILHWLWAMVRKGQVPFCQLFPWFNPSRYAPLLADAKHLASHMARFRLPPAEEKPSPLANAIQGLGLAAALLLGCGGLLIFLYAPATGHMTGWLHMVKESHEILGTLMWIYLGVHGGMGVLHQLAGHGSLRAMFLEWRLTPPA